MQIKSLFANTNRRDSKESIMNRTVSVFILAGICILLQPLALAVDPRRSDSSFTFGLQVRDHNWTEYGDSGEQLIEESGSLYGLFVRLENYLGGRWGIRGDAQVFGGTVDYDGQTQDGTPANTDVDYIGGNVDVGPACRLLGNDQMSLAAFAQVGLRIWNRGLSDDDDAQGYDELWMTTAGRIGAKAQAKLAPNFELFAEGGYRIPIYTREEVDFSDLGGDTVSLEPEEQGSLFAEAGLT